MKRLTCAVLGVVLAGGALLAQTGAEGREEKLTATEAADLRRANKEVEQAEQHRRDLRQRVAAAHWAFREGRQPMVVTTSGGVRYERLSDAVEFLLGDSVDVIRIRPQWMKTWR